MTRLHASAAYRIAFTYACTFIGAVLILGVAVYFAADAEFRHQRDRAISVEVADLLREGDRARVIQELAERGGRKANGSFLYGLYDRQGHRVAGDLDAPMPAPGFDMIVFQDAKEGPDIARAKTVSLADGSRLVVAVDSETVESIDATILALFGIAFLAMVAIGLLGALILARYLRHRLDAIRSTANAIVSGDFDRRMPVGRHHDEFDAAAQALNAMLDRIAGLMDNLRQVSSDVAHDLRAPLLRLRNQLDQIETMDDAARRAIELGDELMNLFTAILRIAEVEGGDIARHFRTINLSALANDVSEAFLPALTDTGHRLDWHITPHIEVMGDRELLTQAIANLLDNAGTHTPAGSRVTLSLEASEGMARLSVTDNGPGVPSADRNKILRRFYRGQASRNTPGNGLGLSLVSAVARSHGGEIAVDDVEPGLCVTIAIPLWVGA